MPSTAMMITLDAVSTIPSAEVVADQVADGFERDVGGQQPEADRHGLCARRSAVGDSVREPVKRQTTITLASPSIALPSAQPTKAIEPAAKPAASPTPPSAIIQASDAQASQRAYRAARSHCSSGLAAVVTAQSSQPVPGAGTAAPGPDVPAG